MVKESINANHEGINADKTIFGWVVSRPCSGGANRAQMSCLNIHSPKPQLDHTLKSFWEIEELQSPPEEFMSPRDSIIHCLYIWYLGKVCPSSHRDESGNGILVWPRISIYKEYLVHHSRWPSLASHPIPRRYFNCNLPKVYLQLHGLADASDNVYAAVTLPKGSIYQHWYTTVSLVTSKTRVTPLKCLTMQHLELCASLLFAKLFSSVQKSLTLLATSVHSWIDSTMVEN